MSSAAVNVMDSDVPACPACGAFDSTLYRHIDIEAQHRAYFPWDEATRRRLSQELAAVRSGYDLMICGVCGLTFAWPMVAPSSVWYQLAYGNWKVKPEERWEYPIVSRELTGQDQVYEIGCGLGVFLAHCKRRDVHAFGIDFSQASVAACRQKGLDAATVDVGMHSATPGPSPASVVVSFQVLEHLASPIDLFELAAQVAAEAAVLWVSIPNSSRISRVLRVFEPVDEPPHHLTKWTDDALRAAGDRTGWELDTVIREPFSWRAALYIVAADSGVYRRLQSSGLLRSTLMERAVRLLIYPFAFLWLSVHPDRRDMGGLSMLARYRRRMETTDLLPSRL